MKKLLCIVLGLLFLFITGCSNSSSIGDDEGTAVKCIKAQGYEIISQNGEIQKYTLEKSKLYGSSETLPYQQMWAVQKVEPDKYFGKEITIYGFTVKNHPLQKKDKNAKSGVNLYIMLAEGKIIGGYSYPNADVFGAYSSLDGKTLEEVTGLSYQQWRENWEKKYSNTVNKSENDIREIAYQSLSEDNRKTVISWKDGKAEQYKSTNDHSIGSPNGLVNIKGKDTYKVTFRTNNEGILGPIIIYIDKNSYSVLGGDLRE